MIWTQVVLAMLKSSLARTAAISAMMFVLGTYTGSTLAVKYYNAQEVAALNAQIAHNEKVIVWSRKTIATLQEEEDRLEKLVKELQNEANKDPNRDKPSLGVDGVRRINRSSLLSRANSPTGLDPHKALSEASTPARESP